MRLLEARRAYADDAEVNAQLDEAFDAIIAGDLDAARTAICRRDETCFDSVGSVIAPPRRIRPSSHQSQTRQTMAG